MYKYTGGILPGVYTLYSQKASTALVHSDAERESTLQESYVPAG